MLLFWIPRRATGPSWGQPAGQFPQQESNPSTFLPINMLDVWYRFTYNYIWMMFNRENIGKYTKIYTYFGASGWHKNLKSPSWGRFAFLRSPRCQATNVPDRPGCWKQVEIRVLISSPTIPNDCVVELNIFPIANLTSSRKVGTNHQQQWGHTFIVRKSYRPSKVLDFCWLHESRASIAVACTPRWTCLNI